MFLHVLRLSVTDDKRDSALKLLSDSHSFSEHQKAYKGSRSAIMLWLGSLQFTKTIKPSSSMPKVYH